MNVRTLCLSILFNEEATGYEIRRLCVEGDCSYFIEASFGSIYPALAKLESEELVTSRVEQQDGRPAKKIYAITDAGRTAFIQALFEPLGDDVFRSPFLLFARFAHLLPQELVAVRLRERLAQIQDSRRKLETLQTEHGINAPDAWTIAHGLACIRAAEEHMLGHMDELIALAKPSVELPQAAE